MKIASFPTPPLFDAPVWGDSLELLDETYPQKLEGWGGENA